MTTVRAGGGGACGLGVSAGAAAGAAAWGGGCPFFFFFDAPKNPMAHRLLLNRRCESARQTAQRAYATAAGIAR
jgi:hypothetical protein